jgi:hypothetical protein
MYLYTNQTSVWNVSDRNTNEGAVQAALAAGIRRMEVRIDPVPNLEEVDLGFFFLDKIRIPTSRKRTYLFFGTKFVSTLSPTRMVGDRVDTNFVPKR